MKRGLTYQLRTLWWRAHAHATNASVLAVATITPAAMRASASVPAARIASCRFGASVRFMVLLSARVDGSFLAAGGPSWLPPRSAGSALAELGSPRGGLPSGSFGLVVFGGTPPGNLTVGRSPPRPPGGRSSRGESEASFRPTALRRPGTGTPPER